MSQYKIVERLHLCADADVRETGRDGTFEQADAEKWALSMEQAASLIQELGEALEMARPTVAEMADRYRQLNHTRPTGQWDRDEIKQSRIVDRIDAILSKLKEAPHG